MIGPEARRDAQRILDLAAARMLDERGPCRCEHMDGDPERACCAHGMRLLCCCREKAA